MNKHYELSRKEYIRLKLRRGDIKLIANQLSVYPEWVSRVIRGEGVSEPILRAAEKIIESRENSKKEG